MLLPLSAWIERTHPLPERFYKKNYIDTPRSDWNYFLTIEEVESLHNANKMQWISLKEARDNTQDYLAAASHLISGLDGAWLDREEKAMIEENLGMPPSPSLPIYLISCSDGATENLVYVGKTKNTSRFNGGHSAALKLHAPEYNKMQKKIYRATPWFFDGKEYISLDWIIPDTLAHDLLDSIESHLIYKFQPILNTQKKLNQNSKWDIYIHIQNFLEGGFLNDTFV